MSIKQKFGLGLLFAGSASFVYGVTLLVKDILHKKRTSSQLDAEEDS